MRDLIEKFLAAWSAQDVEAVAQCYTEDVVYRDPNRRVEINGSEALKHYLRKLFAAWDMRWFKREAFQLKDREGAALLWHATFKKKGGQKMVEADGMDLIIIRNGKVARNEVNFDRTVLSQLS